MLIQIHKECQCRVSMTGQCQNPQCLGANQATDACQSVIKLSWLGYCTKRFTKDTWHMESSDTHKNAIASAHNRWEQVKQNPLKTKEPAIALSNHAGITRTQRRDPVGRLIKSPKESCSYKWKSLEYYQCCCKIFSHLSWVWVISS